MASETAGDATCATPAAGRLPAGTVLTGTVAGTVTVVVSGELDMVAVPSLSQQLAPIMDKRPQRLIFHMGEVSFIDCAAARLIVGTGRALPADRRPTIRSPSAPVRRILRLTGLDAHCEVEG